MVGKHRLGCATRRRKGTCDNAATIVRTDVERRVLEGLRARMLTPALVMEFVRVFAEESAALRKAAVSRSAKAATRLAEVERRIAWLVTSIENGAWNKALGVRLGELEQEQEALQAEVAASTDGEPVVQLHPRAAEIYQEKVAALELSLAEPSIRHEAVDGLSGLIDRVTLTPEPGTPDGLRIEFDGVLASILSLASPNRARPVGRAAFSGRSNRQSSVVAGTGGARGLSLPTMSC